jgi:hypothetical protein
LNSKTTSPHSIQMQALLRRRPHQKPPNEPGRFPSQY